MFKKRKNMEIINMVDMFKKLDITDVEITGQEGIKLAIIDYLRERNIGVKIN